MVGAGGDGGTTGCSVGGADTGPANPEYGRGGTGGAGGSPAEGRSHPLVSAPAQGSTGVRSSGASR